MKTPIEPQDIKAGDLIRVERTLTEMGKGFASSLEFTASKDGKGWPWSKGQHFLLDRPTPPVSLPTEPTLGIATFSDGTVKVGDCYVRSDSFFVGGVASSRHTPDTITSFTPATVVPTTALAALRQAQVNNSRGGRTPDSDAISAFLAAIEASA